MSVAQPQSPGPAARCATIHPRVAMIQGAARLGYVVPVALQRAGILEQVFADFYVKQPSAAALFLKVLGSMRPGLTRVMAGRHSSELDPAKVIQNPWLGMREY